MIRFIYKFRTLLIVLEVIISTYLVYDYIKTKRECENLLQQVESLHQELDVLKNLDTYNYDHSQIKQ